MARNSRSTFRKGVSQTQRRKKAWIDMNLGPARGEDIIGSALLPPDIVAGPGESVAVLQFPSQAGFIESTILRIRGYVDVPKSASSIGADGSSATAFGIGIVSDQAATALAVPNPATATGQDWDGWMFLRSSSQIAVDINGTMLDIKSMRKWQSGDSIVVVAGAATTAAGGYSSLSVAFSLRGLFLLP